MRASYHAVIAVIIILGFASCKHKDNLNVEPVRLLAIESPAGLRTTPALRFSFEYDQDDRITKILVFTDSMPLTTYYNVSYASNEISMFNHTDSIHLFLGAGESVERRIHSSLYLYKDANNIEERDYGTDTSLYQYNANGLLLKRTYVGLSRDSFSTGTTFVSRMSGEVNYTSEDSDAVGMKNMGESLNILYRPTGADTSRSFFEYAFSFHYAQQYENKTDFSNAAVLNELGMHSYLPLNKNYAHLPDQIDYAYVERDENGNILRSGHTTFNDTLNFNSYGFVQSRTDPTLPLGMVEFIYDR